MKGLNKIFREIERIRSEFLKIFPDESKELNNIFNSYLQIFENLVYSETRGNTNRYSKMKKDVPIESALTVIENILVNLGQMNRDDADSAIAVLGAKLEHIKWDVDSALKSINKLQSKFARKK